MTDWQQMYPIYLFSNVLVGIILAFLMGLLAIWFTRRFGPMDIPGTQPHKQHRVPTPLAGGLALMLALLFGSVFFNRLILADLWRILLPALVIFGVAVWDDFVNLPPGVKLISQLVAGILLIALGTYVHILKSPLLGLGSGLTLLLNWGITLFWVVGITNATNFIDSMDGLVLGVSTVAAAFMILTTTVTQASLLQLLTLLFGIFLGLYFFNVTPARFFLGDSGAQTIGFLLAAVAILFTPGSSSSLPQESSWFLPILILGVPIFDTTLVVISRLRRRAPIYSSGHDHTYHRLIDMGLDANRAVLVMHLVSIVLGCLAFVSLYLQPVYANLVFAVVCVAGGTLIFIFERSKRKA